MLGVHGGAMVDAAGWTALSLLLSLQKQQHVTIAAALHELELRIAQCCIDNVPERQLPAAL